MHKLGAILGRALFKITTGEYQGRCNLAQDILPPARGGEGQGTNKGAKIFVKNLIFKGLK